MLFQRLLTTGLLIILLMILGLIRREKEKDGLANRFLVRRSKYRALERFIFAQAKHESGNFTSLLYREGNNMFGFKTRSSKENGRPAPDGGLYRYYGNDGESVEALLDWMERKNFPLVISSADEYAIQLKSRGYFTDRVSNYVNGLNYYLENE